MHIAYLYAGIIEVVLDKRVERSFKMNTDQKERSKPVKCNDLCLINY